MASIQATLAPKTTWSVSGRENTSADDSCFWVSCCVLRIRKDHRRKSPNCIIPMIQFGDCIMGIQSPNCIPTTEKVGHQSPTFSVVYLFLTVSLSSSCDKHALTRYYVKPISPVFISRYVHATLPWPPKNPTSNQRATNTVEKCT